MILSYPMNKHDATTGNPVTKVYKNVAERKDWEPSTPSHPLPRELESWAEAGWKQQIEISRSSNIFNVHIKSCKTKNRNSNKILVYMAASHCNHSFLFGSGMCNTDKRIKNLKTEEIHPSTHTFLVFVIFY